jgi:uncharacterized membrane protein
MVTPETYILISIIILLVIAVLVFLTGKKQNRLTSLAGLAFSFTIAGIIFGGSRLTGYILMGIGVILAVIDIFRRSVKN